MKVKTKVLYEADYKDGDSFDEALERWVEKGWTVADTVYSFVDNMNAGIIYKIEEDAMRIQAYEPVTM